MYICVRGCGWVGEDRGGSRGQSSPGKDLNIVDETNKTEVVVTYHGRDPLLSFQLDVFFQPDV